MPCFSNTPEGNIIDIIKIYDEHGEIIPLYSAGQGYAPAALLACFDSTTTSEEAYYAFPDSDSYLRFCAKKSMAYDKYAKLTSIVTWLRPLDENDIVHPDETHILAIAGEVFGYKSPKPHHNVHVIIRGHDSFFTRGVLHCHPPDRDWPWIYAQRVLASVPMDILEEEIKTFDKDLKDGYAPLCNNSLLAILALKGDHDAPETSYMVLGSYFGIASIEPPIIQALYVQIVGGRQVCRKPSHLFHLIKQKYRDEHPKKTLILLGPNVDHQTISNILAEAPEWITVLFAEEDPHPRPLDCILETKLDYFTKNFTWEISESGTQGDVVIHVALPGEDMEELARFYANDPRRVEIVVPTEELRRGCFCSIDKPTVFPEVTTSSMFFSKWSPRLLAETKTEEGFGELKGVLERLFTSTLIHEYRKKVENLPVPLDKVYVANLMKKKLRLCDEICD